MHRPPGTTDVINLPFLGSLQVSLPLHYAWFEFDHEGGDRTLPVLMRHKMRRDSVGKNQGGGCQVITDLLHMMTNPSTPYPLQDGGRCPWHVEVHETA